MVFELKTPIGAFDNSVEVNLKVLTGVNCLIIGGGLSGMHHQQSPLVVHNSATVSPNCRIMLADSQDCATGILLLHLFSFLLWRYVKQTFGGRRTGAKSGTDYAHRALCFN